MVAVVSLNALSAAFGSQFLPHWSIEHFPILF